MIALLLELLIAAIVLKKPDRKLVGIKVIKYVLISILIWIAAMCAYGNLVLILMFSLPPATAVAEAILYRFLVRHAVDKGKRTWVSVITSVLGIAVSMCIMLPLLLM